MRLDIDDRDFFYIGWYDPEDGDFGAYLGDKLKDPEHNAAEEAVKDSAHGKDARGLYWETKRAANSALRLARTAIANLERPMPEWAKTAAAEGWKPPRGWRPPAPHKGEEQEGT